MDGGHCCGEVWGASLVILLRDEDGELRGEGSARTF